MTLHVPRLPLSLDPLFGEAKRRMRRRRVLVGIATVALVGAATATALALRPSGGATPSGFASSGAVSVGRLTVPVPRGFSQYDIRGGIYKTGTRPPVIGHVLTDYPVSPQIQRYGISASAPANGVALELQWWIAIGPPPPTRLHLPLSLHEQWSKQSLPRGTKLWGWLSDGRPGHVPYQLVLWIGRDAAPGDRAALLHALAAIHKRGK